MPKLFARLKLGCKQLLFREDAIVNYLIKKFIQKYKMKLKLRQQKNIHYTENSKKEV